MTTNKLGLVPQNYNDVKIVLQDIVHPKPELYDYSKHDIDKLPQDYHDFINFFGEGLFGIYLRIFPPSIIHMVMLGWRDAILKVSHFENNQVLSKENLKKAIIIGDTLDDDQLIYYNKNYYVYCFQEPEILIIKVGNKLSDIFKWYASGKYWEAIDFKTFTPFLSRETASPLYNRYGNFKVSP